MPVQKAKTDEYIHLLQRYRVAIDKLRALAAQPDFTDEGEWVFFDLFKECKALNNQIVDLENAGQSK